MSAEHNHAPRCCCAADFEHQDRPSCPACPMHGGLACICGTPGLNYAGPERDCPTHGELATPYTEQETTK